MVHDLQTREKAYFICEKWLAIDKDDCKIERIVNLSLDSEKTQYNYLLTKSAKEKFTEDHLWLSVFTRPVQSSFTRLDRLTCCFVLLSISMVMNIMYYGMDNSSNSGGLQIGPYINVTLQQISVGMISSIIVLVPSLLLVQLFKRIKRRQTRISQIKKILNEDMKIKEENIQKPKSKKTFELKLPWWFKIFAYMLSFAFAGVSLFFVVVKGIVFGDDKVAKWLTSLIVSFFASILLTQPLKVKCFKVDANISLKFVYFAFYLCQDRYNHIHFRDSLQKI